MKKILKVIAILIFIGFVGIQFIRPNRTNPPINEAETLEATTYVPENIEAIFNRSCNDCHSNKTVYPWYSNVAPISWKLVEHIEEGRDEMNFSKWGTYSKERKQRKLEKICEEVEAGEMPHNQYLWLHWDAKLSDEQIKILCNWTKNEMEKIEKSKNS
ncbi:MAG: heme-binding domain-containing protein [Aridibacter sp.]